VQIATSAMAFLNLGPLAYLLSIHLKKNRLRKKIKTITISAMILLQTFTFVHYFFYYPAQFRSVLLAFQSLMTCFTCFGICYMCCKQCSRLLPSSAKWLNALKALGICCSVISMISSGSLIIYAI
jgi:hypothetical protein